MGRKGDVLKDGNWTDTTFAGTLTINLWDRHLHLCEKHGL